jgi:transcriptional regulator of acetoin/glycerol metabolism
LQYASVFADHGVIERDHLPDDFRVEVVKPALSARDSIEQAEHGALRQLLESHHWHISNTAKALGIGRNTLYRRMARLGIERSG